MAVPQDRVLLLSVEREIERLRDVVEQNTEDVAGDATILTGVAEMIEGHAGRLDDLERRLGLLAEAAAKTSEVLATILAEVAALRESQDTTLDTIELIVERLKRAARDQP